MEKLAFIFPGQGSQYVGMGVSLCEKFSSARKVFNDASKICGYDVLSFCGNSSYKELVNDEKSLPTLLTISIATYRVFEELTNLKPDYFSGYSFGELAALVCANSIEFHDALRIAVFKAQLAKKLALKGKFAMTSIEDKGLGYPKLKKLCENLSQGNVCIEVAAINSKDNFVISGDLELIKKIEKKLKREENRITRLTIESPYHTKYFKKFSTESKKEMKKFEIKKPEIPVVSSLSADILKNEKSIIDSQVRYLYLPVNWEKTLDFFVASKVKTLVELGPKNILTPLSWRKGHINRIYSFSSPKDVKKIEEIFVLSKQDVLSILDKCINKILVLRNNNEDENQYEEMVEGSLMRMKNKLKSLQTKKEKYKENDVIDFFNDFKIALKGKKVSTEEFRVALKEVFGEYGKLKYVKNLKCIWEEAK